MPNESRLSITIDSRNAEQKARDLQIALEAMDAVGIRVSATTAKAGASFSAAGGATRQGVSGVAGILQNSPKDMLAQYWLQKNYDQRQQTADRQFGLGQQRVGLQVQGLGISASDSAESARHNRTMEDIAGVNAARQGNSVGTLQGLDPSGKSPNVFVTPVYKQFDPKTGSYGITVGAPQDTGVKPLKTGLFDEMTGGGLGFRGIRSTPNPLWPGAWAAACWPGPSILRQHLYRNLGSICLRSLRFLHLLQNPAQGCAVAGRHLACQVYRRGRIMGSCRRVRGCRAVTALDQPRFHLTLTTCSLDIPP